MNESIINQLTHRDIDRIRRYKELLDFYRGKHWEGRERWGEKRLTFNYAKVFVDKLTSYLMSGINFAVDAYNQPKVINFYEKNGFKKLTDKDKNKNTRSLFFDLKRLKSA